MTNIEEIKQWIGTLNDSDFVAIDDGGLTLVVLDHRGVETGAYMEVGGVPEENEGEQGEE